MPMPELPTHLGLQVRDLVVFAAFLMLASIFSAAETALFALSDVRVQDIVNNAKERGQRVRSLLRYWVNSPEHVLTALLLGKHSAHVALVISTCVTLDAARKDLLQHPVVAVVVGFVIVIVTVAVELWARALAKGRAESVAPLVFPVVVVAYWIFYPLHWALAYVSRALADVAGGGDGRAGHQLTDQDIIEMIAMGRRSGAIDKTEGRMLANIIELSGTLVKELMVARAEVSALLITSTYEEVLAAAKEKGHSRIPIFEGSLDDIKGFFHFKDLLTGVIDPSTFRLREHLRTVEFVPELMRVADLLRLFQKKKTHLAIVVDEFGGTAGIVALEDVLEEIVGPIHDEHDEVDATIRKISDNHWSAEGRVSLYELGEVLHIVFPEGGYETLGGFLIARCGRMPRKGDRVSFQGYTFLVTEADERKVSRLDIEKNPTPATVPPKVATASVFPAHVADNASAHIEGGEPRGPQPSAPYPPSDEGAPET